MAKVKAAPQTARLITINDTDGTAYNIIPAGDEVEIPNRLAKGPFVQALAKENYIVLTDVDEDEAEEDAQNGDDEELAALRAQAEELGIEVDKRWKVKRLQAEIDAASGKE